VITEEKEEREGKMSKFKVGDRVICVKSSDFYIGGEAAQKGFEGVVAEIRNSSLRFKGSTSMYLASRFELMQDNKEQDMEKKYKINTEFSLGQIIQLHSFTGDMGGLTGLFSACGCILSREGVKYSPKLSCYLTGGGFDFVNFQDACNAKAKEAQRKVVKVGDKEYYEDELSAALANIKPIK
jgi:hypothetical protein